MLQGHPGHDPSTIANSQPLGFLLLPQTQWRGEVICHCIIHLRLPYQCTVMSQSKLFLHLAISSSGLACSLNACASSLMCHERISNQGSAGIVSRVSPWAPCSRRLSSSSL